MGRAVPVTVGGRTYPSIADAARVLGLTRQCMQKRLARISSHGGPGKRGRIKGSVSHCSVCRSAKHKRPQCPDKPPEPTTLLRSLVAGPQRADAIATATGRSVPSVVAELSNLVLARRRGIDLPETLKDDFVHVRRNTNSCVDYL